MRSGLITLGVILLVLGAIFYFIPQPMSAGSALQQQVSLFAMIVGALLVLMGIILPDPEVRIVQADSAAERRVVYERDDIDDDLDEVRKY